MPLHDTPAEIDSAEIDDLRAEVGRLWAHADSTPRDPACEMTPGQFITYWNSRTPDQRLDLARSIIEDRALAARCFVTNHEGEIQHLRSQIAADEPRRVEADTDYLGDDGLNPWTDEEGMIRRPGAMPVRGDL